MPKSDLEWWLAVSGQISGPPLGAFVCTAVLQQALRVEQVDHDNYGDFSANRFAWHLTDIEQINPPIPAKGQQGFWMWDQT